MCDAEDCERGGDACGMSAVGGVGSRETKGGTVALDGAVVGYIICDFGMRVGMSFGVWNAGWMWLVVVGELGWF